MLEFETILFIVLVIVGFGVLIQQTVNFFRRRKMMESTYERVYEIESSNARRVAGQVDGIAARDPEFDEDSFLSSACETFEEIRDTFSTGDFESVHRYVSDAMLRRFTAKAAVDEHSNKRFFGEFRTISHTIFLVDEDEDFDTIHVHFRVAERGTYVPANLSAEEARIQSRRDSEEKSQSEYWSFVRRRDATNKGKLTEGKCPNCGGAVEKVATTTCEYCDAVLNSGSYDWVLSKISRERSLDRSADRQAEGFPELKASDRALNKHVLEDKASLVFWKWIEAQVLGEPTRFARFCTPTAYEKAREWEGRSAKILTRVAIVSVDLVRVERGTEMERAWFRIRWKRWSISAGWQLQVDFMALDRKAGLETNPRRGMATERCHGCAAVQTARDTVQCDYCGTLLSEDWAFVDLIEPSEFAKTRSGLRAGA